MAADTQAPADTQSANGVAPAPATDQPCEDCASGSEKIMGIAGLAFALVLGFIAADLLKGGALSRALFARGDDASE